jgi:hypothetical protein
MPVTGAQIRAVLLQTVAEQHRMTGGSPAGGSLQQVSILAEVVKRLGQRLTPPEEQALLTAWYDLFRDGQMSWGYNLNNPDPPFCHITEQGRRTLAQISRDPYNRDGYIRHLNEQGQLNDVAASYIVEALNTYNTNCFRATAVMVGAAAESLVLEIRDQVVEGIARAGRTPAKGLNDFRIKQVLDSLRKEFEMQQSGMSAELREAVESYWPAFVQQIRAARNEAGHPASIEPVTAETVHASLLIFPELASLSGKLLEWSQANYT